jgi:DNA topoisomerase I
MDMQNAPTLQPANPMFSREEAVGLVYVNDADPGVRRRRTGKGFAYYRPNGALVRDRTALARIRALAIPPAWTDVWISPVSNGHIQATGRDARGRKQYRYHAAFREQREQAKYEHMLEFAGALPAIRQQVARDMTLPGIPRRKALATVVHLLDTTLIRVGNADYAEQNKSYGLTTLKDRHATINGGELRFDFVGKSGKRWRLQMRDRRLAKIVKTMQDLPGQHLFQYLDEDGAPQKISSSDVNTYLRDVSGADLTAKDFRTWAGTVLAAVALCEFEEVDNAAAAKRNVRRAIEKVASRLGNTPTICRKCYVHPEILGSYMDQTLIATVQGEVDRVLREDLAGLSAEEAAVLALLHARLREGRPPVAH